MFFENKKHKIDFKEIKKKYIYIKYKIIEYIEIKKV